MLALICRTSSSLLPSCGSADSAVVDNPRRVGGSLLPDNVALGGGANYERPTTQENRPGYVASARTSAMRPATGQPAVARRPEAAQMACRAAPPPGGARCATSADSSSDSYETDYDPEDEATSRRLSQLQTSQPSSAAGMVKNYNPQQQQQTLQVEVRERAPSTPARQRLASQPALAENAELLVAARKQREPANGGSDGSSGGSAWTQVQKPALPLPYDRVSAMCSPDELKIFCHFADVDCQTV